MLNNNNLILKSCNIKKNTDLFECSTTALASDEKKYSVEWSSPSGVNSVQNQQHHNSISEIYIVVVKYHIYSQLEWN